MFPHTVPVRFWNDLLYSITLASVLVMTFLGEASTNWGVHDGGLHRRGRPGHGDLRVFAAVLHPGFHRRCGERIRQTVPALSLLIAPSALLLPRSVSGWSAQNRSLYAFLFLLIFGKQRKHRMFGASAVCAYGALLLIVGFFVECADAVPAYAFLLKSNQIPRCAAEQTGLLKLTDNNQIFLQIDLDPVPILNIHRPPQLNRQDDPAKLIDSSDDPGCFHTSSFLPRLWSGMPQARHPHGCTLLLFLLPLQRFPVRICTQLLPHLIPVGLTDKIVTVCRLLHIQVAASFATEVFSFLKNLFPGPLRMHLNLRRFSLLHGTMRTEHVLDMIFCSLGRPP